MNDEYSLQEVDSIKVYISNVLVLRDNKVSLKYTSLFGKVIVSKIDEWSNAEND